jgi:hypothetical protein
MLLIIPAMLALAFGAATIGPGLATAQPAPLLVVDQSLDEHGNGPGSCSGGVQEATLADFNDQPTTIGEMAAFQALPTASVSFVTPNMDSDLITVLFTGEARVTGQPVTYTPPVDFLELQIWLDGVPMSPLNDLAFATGAGEGDAAQTCKRVGPGNHTVTVQWRVVDQDAMQALTATLDDWLLEVEISN